MLGDVRQSCDGWSKPEITKAPQHFLRLEQPIDMAKAIVEEQRDSRRACECDTGEASSMCSASIAKRAHHQSGSHGDRGAHLRRTRCWIPRQVEGAMVRSHPEPSRKETEEKRKEVLVRDAIASVGVGIGIVGGIS